MREEGYAYVQFVSRTGFPITNNIFYHTPLRSWCSHMSTSEDCILDENLYYNAAGEGTRFTRYDWSWASMMNAVRGFGDDVNSIFDQDPLFVDPNNHNYRLQSNSPALLTQGSGGIGFVDFADEIAKVGPRTRKYWRTRKTN